MSKYTSTVIKKFKFQDQEAVVTFRRLKRKHMLKLLPVIKEFESKRQELDEQGLTKEQINTKLSGETFELVEVAMAYAPDYVVSIEGLTDNANNPIDKDVILEEAYFMELCSEIVSCMMEESLGPLAQKRRSSKG